MKKKFTKKIIFSESLVDLESMMNSPNYKNYELISVYINTEGIYIAFLQKEECND